MEWGVSIGRALLGVAKFEREVKGFGDAGSDGTMTTCVSFMSQNFLSSGQSTRDDQLIENKG